MERLLRDIDLPSLTLGVVPAAAEVDVLPMPGFDMNDSGQVGYELVSTGVDITDEDELTLHDKAFRAMSSAASYGDAAKELIGEALGFWGRSAR